MTSHGDGFDLYTFVVPPRIDVYCAPGFREHASELFHKHLPVTKAMFANMNQLLDRFAHGERLSDESFRSEGKDGWAFRAGRLRFYGMYSVAHASCFVLSHAIFKGQQKLAAGDLQKMRECRDAFDKLIVIPKRGARA